MFDKKVNELNHEQQIETQKKHPDMTKILEQNVKLYNLQLDFVKDVFDLQDQDMKAFRRNNSYDDVNELIADLQDYFSGNEGEEKSAQKSH